MSRQGVLHDYDLQANIEPSADGQICVICGAHPMLFQWSDYSGEAMCTQCGCPYQLKWGTKEQEEEGKYPYLRLLDEFVPVLKEYWEETKSFTCLGLMIGRKPGLEAFEQWVSIHHPELLEKEESNEN